MQFILMMLVCFQPPQIFNATGAYAPEAVAAEVVAVKPAEVVVPQTGKRYLAMFTATYCGPCQTWKRQQKSRVEAAGYTVIEYEMTASANKQKYSDRVSRYPTFVVVDWDAGKWLSDPVIGSISAETAIAMLAKASPAVSTPVVTPVAKQPPVPTVVTTPTLSPPIRYIQWPGYGTIDLETYSRGTTRKTEAAGRFVQYGTTTYDMETWQRMCSLRSCGMCKYLESMQAQYVKNKAALVVEQPSPQSASPPEVVDEAIAIMQLTTADVVAELGCGDGGPAIQMVKKSGCRVEGYEIDPLKVAAARRNVEAAGLSHRITIHEADVVGLKLPESITAVYAFLYPELLAKIQPQLVAGRVTVCPGHKPAGLEMNLVGQCWVRYN